MKIYYSLQVNPFLNTLIVHNLLVAGEIKLQKVISSWVLNQTILKFED